MNDEAYYKVFFGIWIVFVIVDAVSLIKGNVTGDIGYDELILCMF